MLYNHHCYLFPKLPHQPKEKLVPIKHQLRIPPLLAVDNFYSPSVISMNVTAYSRSLR